MNDLIPKLRPSPGRRWFAALSLLVVGGAAAWFGLFGPDRTIGIRAVSGAAAAGFLLQAWRCRGDARSSIRLTPEGLFDGGGNCICRTGNIASIERSLFSMRPSNGFMIRLREPAAVRWMPGVYWRVGRRVGVGGLLRPADVRAMADRIALLAAENRRAPDSGTPRQTG